MKSVLRELRRAPEFVRWRKPLLVFFLLVRECLRPFFYWFIFDIFETDLRQPLAEPYAKDNLEVRIYGGNKDLKSALEDLTSLDDLLPADIQLRFGRGDVAAVAYAADKVVGCMWLTFSDGIELAFGTSWIIRANEALRYGAFVHPGWRGRAIHSLLNSTLNRYARECGMIRTLGGVSVLNSQSSSLARHFRKLRAMRVVIFHIRGVKWTYRKALGAPLESRFAIAQGVPSRSSRPEFIGSRLWK
jgi:GNAT superfamily N-acetyltransferase